MNKVIVRLKTSSIRDAEIFYCKELELFEFYQDYGMETISLIAKDNSSFILLLTSGTVTDTDEYLFELEVNNCTSIFDKLKQKEFKTTGRLLSPTVFEYPLGKSIAFNDPSNNKFLLFEEYKP
jgi:hypothetical protein